MNRATLLTIDGIINLLLGVLLVAFPKALVDFLGIPSATPSFYPNILGGILFGIGVALLMERKNTSGGGIGLGLHGAVAINLCGAWVLGAWLMLGGLTLPVRGLIFLWFLVAMLVGISAIEIISGIRKHPSDA
jgi:hypothetical protein